MLGVEHGRARPAAALVVVDDAVVDAVVVDAVAGLLYLFVHGSVDALAAQGVVVAVRVDELV